MFSFSRREAGFQQPSTPTLCLPHPHPSITMARASLTSLFSEMKPFLYAALTGYVVAAIHAVLAFVNKRRSAERIAFYSVVAGFAAHTGALVVDWVSDGHYPLFSTPEALSFLAWTFVVAYWIATYKYPLRALGAFL